MSAPALSPARNTAGDGAVPRCDSMSGGPEPLTADQLAEWMLLTDKCMEPADAVIEFTCGNGHRGRRFICDPHLRGYGDQLCGYCADAGKRVLVTVRVVGRC